jgi:hypothetical protein
MDMTSWRGHEYCPTVWKLGEWTELLPNVAGSAACGHGYHLGYTMWNAMSYGELPCRIFKAKGRYRYGYSRDKARYGKAKILKEVTPKDLVKINNFIIKQTAMKRITKKGPASKHWKVFATYAKASHYYDKAMPSNNINVLEECNTAALPKGSFLDWRHLDYLSSDINGITEMVSKLFNKDSAKASDKWNSVEYALEEDLIAMAYVLVGALLPDNIVRLIRRRWAAWMKGYGVFGNIGFGKLVVYKSF